MASGAGLGLLDKEAEMGYTEGNPVQECACCTMRPRGRRNWPEVDGPGRAIIVASRSTTGVQVGFRPIGNRAEYAATIPVRLRADVLGLRLRLMALCAD